MLDASGPDASAEQTFVTQLLRDFSLRDLMSVTARRRRRRERFMLYRCGVRAGRRSIDRPLHDDLMLLLIILGCFYFKLKMRAAAVDQRALNGPRPS